MKYLVNQDAIIKAIPVLPTSIPPDGIPVDIGFSDPGIISNFSVKSKCNNKFLSINNFSGAWDAVKLCPIRSATYIFVIGGVVVVATATKEKADSFPVHLDQDAGNCVGQFTDPQGAPFVCNCTVKIDQAGQNKVSGI